ncbi:MAG TPA: hypothetical protein VMW48_08435 [Vicinamibacterales bacterium]|nr:hypothetical protein [Vicinamibacterales bacterium]
MNNSIFIEKDVTATFQKLSDAEMVASGELMTPPSNAADVEVKGSNDSVVHFKPGQSNPVRSINLAEVLFQGTVGDKLVFVGGTW